MSLMIWIDLEHRRPTDEDLPTTIRWLQAKWDGWIAKSKRLALEVAKLNAAGKKQARNAFIDANSEHWAQLKPWLLHLSAGKCWFSEVRELYSHYDVEHFRPKREAKDLDASVRDGYWWLSFNYLNFRICGNVGNRKKGGWFPLQAGSRCSTYDKQCEELETAYLLDPIDIEDVNLLAFDEAGRMIPRPGASDWEARRVAETVLRLKLNGHLPLAEARRKVWNEVDGLIRAYQDAVERTREGGNEVARQKAKAAAIALQKMTHWTAELSGVARWCVLLRNDPRLARLISVGSAAPA